MGCGWRQPTVQPYNRMTPCDSTGSLLCNNCGVDSGCPHVCSAHTLLREELLYPVTRRGQHWLVFSMGPQGQWGFINHVIQKVSHDKDQHITTEMSPSPACSPPVFSSPVWLLSFQEDNVERHDQTGNRHGNVKPRPNYRSWKGRWRIERIRAENYRSTYKKKENTANHPTKLSPKVKCIKLQCVLNIFEHCHVLFGCDSTTGQYTWNKTMTEIKDLTLRLLFSYLHIGPAHRGHSGRVQEEIKTSVMAWLGAIKISSWASMPVSQHIHQNSDKLKEKPE